MNEHAESSTQNTDGAKWLESAAKQVRQPIPSKRISIGALREWVPDVAAPHIGKASTMTMYHVATLPQHKTGALQNDRK